jgi:hypothetical protein
MRREIPETVHSVRLRADPFLKGKIRKCSDTQNILTKNSEKEFDETVDSSKVPEILSIVRCCFQLSDYGS